MKAQKPNRRNNTMSETWEIIECAAVAAWLLLPVAVAIFLERGSK